MPRYISRRSTRSNTLEPTYQRALETQQQEYLRLLKRESDKLLTEFKEQIIRTMREEMEQSLRSATRSATQTTSGGGTDAFTPSFSGIAGFLSGALRIYLGRPKYSQSVSESQRSVQTGSQFRAARAESLAELSGTLAASERNG